MNDVIVHRRHLNAVCMDVRRSLPTAVGCSSSGGNPSGRWWLTMGCTAAWSTQIGRSFLSLD